MLAPELVPRFRHALSNGVANTLLLLPPVATGACVTPHRRFSRLNALRLNHSRALKPPQTRFNKRERERERDSFHVPVLRLTLPFLSIS